MEKEFIFHCKTCGKIESRDVEWITLQQSVDMSFCPKCHVQISRIFVNKVEVPEMDKPVLRAIKQDTYRELFSRR